MSTTRATIIEVSLVLAAVVLLIVLFSRSYQQPAAPLSLSIDGATSGLSESWAGI